MYIRNFLALPRSHSKRLAKFALLIPLGQLIVAGGETSGSVVQALGMTQLQSGAQIDPGVPWCAGKTAVSEKTLHITLKSGNFGTSDFFSKAFHRID